MKTPFISEIISSNASLKSRNQFYTLVINNDNFFLELLHFAFETNTKGHHKAIWILEMIAEQQPHLFFNHLDFICNHCHLIVHESGTRALARTLHFITKFLTLSENQEKIIKEKCLDWLISNERVACKMHAIYTLYILSKKDIELRENLKVILTEDFHKHTAAYKAVARDILKRLH